MFCGLDGTKRKASGPDSGPMAHPIRPESYAAAPFCPADFGAHRNHHPSHAACSHTPPPPPAHLNFPRICPSLCSLRLGHLLDHEFDHRKSWPVSFIPCKLFSIFTHLHFCSGSLPLYPLSHPSTNSYFPHFDLSHWAPQGRDHHFPQILALHSVKLDFI